MVFSASIVWISPTVADRKSTRLNSSHGYISYAVFCLKKKTRERRRVVQAAPDLVNDAAARKDARPPTNPLALPFPRLPLAIRQVLPPQFGAPDSPSTD